MADRLDIAAEAVWLSKPAELRTNIWSVCCLLKDSTPLQLSPASAGLKAPLEAEVAELDVTAGGDVAFASGIHHLTGTMRGGKKVDYRVRVTDCFKKISGKWLIAHTQVSVPADMGTGKAEVESKP